MWILLCNYYASVSLSHCLLISRSTVISVCTLKEEQRLELTERFSGGHTEIRTFDRIIPLLPDISLITSHDKGPYLRSTFLFIFLFIILLFSFWASSGCLRLPLISACCCGSVQHTHGRVGLTGGLLVRPLVGPPALPLQAVPFCRLCRCRLSHLHG